MVHCKWGYTGKRAMLTSLAFLTQLNSREVTVQLRGMVHQHVQSCAVASSPACLILQLTTTQNSSGLQWSKPGELPQDQHQIIGTRDWKVQVGPLPQNNASCINKAQCSPARHPAADDLREPLHFLDLVSGVPV